MEKINIKALSVNSCYQGKRFKNQVHKEYVSEVMRQLPIFFIGRPPYKLILEFGLSSKLQDLDNCIKVFQDCLTVKYDFNDTIVKECMKLISEETGMSVREIQKILETLIN